MIYAPIVQLTTRTFSLHLHLKRWLSSEHTRTDFRRMLSFCLKNYRELSEHMQMLSRNRRNHISWKVCKLEKTHLFSYMLLFYVNAQHMQKGIIFGDTGDYSLSQIRIGSKTPAINISGLNSRATCSAQHSAGVVTHLYIQIFSRIFAKLEIAPIGYSLFRSWKSRISLPLR